MMERRDFVKASALAGIGSLVLPNTVFAGNDVNTRKVRLGFIAVGYRGQSHIDEMLKTLLKTQTHRILGIRPRRKGENFEFRAIVRFEQARDQLSDGMMVEIRRKVTNSQPVLELSLGERQHVFGRRVLGKNPSSRGTLLQVRIRCQREKRKG